MGLKIILSEFSQQKLIENIEQPWFIELIYVLNNAGSCSENPYLSSSKRPLTEVEYQALNGSFRQGCLATVQAIFSLALPSKKNVPEEMVSWGELKPEPASPKVFQDKPTSIT